MKIGDIVYSKKFGKGKIIYISNITPPYGVEFENYNSSLHTLGGRCKNGYGLWCNNNVKLKNAETYIEPYKFTKKDLKKGYKLTTRDGKELTYLGKDGYCVNIDKEEFYYLIGLQKDLTIKNRKKSVDDIVKVERPTYTTIFEREVEILDEKEKEYLLNVIRPFKDDIRYISKFNSINDNEYICIALNREGIVLPDFKKGTMYKGMEFDKKYTLKELGLDE